MRAGDDAERSDEEERRHVSVPRVVVTADAAALLDQLREQHGPLMFHQSGGCCDGSSPMCYPDGDFIIGDRDVLLGLLDVGPDGVPVWISGPQFQAWKHTQLVIDVVPGRGGGFSLEAPEGKRFLSRGRAFTAAENADLTASALVTGADYERGERLPDRAPVVATAVDAPPQAGGAPGPVPAGRAAPLKP